MAIVKHATLMHIFLKAQSQHLIIGKPSDVRGKGTIRIILLFAVVGEAVTIFDANTVGPRSYIRMYDSYRDILTGDTWRHQGQSRSLQSSFLFQGQSEKDKDAFLASDASLEQFKERMDG